MITGAQGIVSYAGLSKNALLSGAEFPVWQGELPARFRDFIPLFPAEMIQNMEYVGKESEENKFAAPSGFSTDPAAYHRKMFLETPSLYAGDNWNRNFGYDGSYQGRGVFTVDAAWADAFPQYRPFLGERLVVHLIGGGCQAVAVPESLKIRSGFLDRLEEVLEITARVQSFVRYAAACVRSGEPYDADVCAAEYLQTTDRQAVNVTQRELELTLQRRAMAQGRRAADGGEMFYLQKARQAGRIGQYQPYRYACDFFTEQTVTPAFVRLAQPYTEGLDFVSDFWIPYAEVLPYVTHGGTALQMRALCESFQIAPAFDPETGGGVYPNALRVAVIRDRELTIMTAEALNNGAYGSGLNADGRMCRHVFIANSLEQIRARRIDVEKITFRCDSDPLPPEQFLAQRKRAKAQEAKGRLIDALYRLYMAQSGGEADAETLRRLREKANALLAAVPENGGGVSGYDSDIRYLRQRLEANAPEDPQREASVECGYAMRNAYCRPQSPGADEPQEDPAEEKLQETAEEKPQESKAEKQENAAEQPPQPPEEQPPQPAAEKPRTIAAAHTKGDHRMKLTPKDIAKMLDHSTLQPFLTQADVRTGCEIALKYGAASVCARPADMPLVKEMLSGSDVRVCTVIGFPHGNHKPEIKIAEAEAALADGCEELDMVINVGRLIAGDDQYVQDEIADICALAHSHNAKVKVIIETCYLTDEQKVRVCRLAAAAGADWVKTSTGYGTAGCKLEDVILMRRSVPADCQVKGSGGIRDLDTVLALRAVGATRCGVSATEKIMAEAEVRFANGTLMEASLEDLSFEEDGSY